MTVPQAERLPIVLVSEADGDFSFLHSMLARRGPVAALSLDSDGLSDERIAQAIDEVAGDGPAALIGHSLGASACVRYAAADARVAALVLIAGWVTPSERQRIHARTLAALDDAAVGDYLAFTHYSEAQLAADPLTHPRTGRDIAVLAASTDVGELLAQVTATTLVIGCTDDLLIAQEQGLALAGGISDARYAAVDSGHGVLDERPAELLSLIDGFLDDPTRYPAGTAVARMRP